MGFKIIMNNFINWLQLWIGKYIFRKTRLRYLYKEKLKEIVDGFADAIEANCSKTCSLISIINNVKPGDLNKNIQIQNNRRLVELLERWYSAFRDKPDFLMLKYVSRLFEEFARILYETGRIFNEFFQLIKKDEEIKVDLKSDSSGYPYFEKIYNKITTDFEQLCKEASRSLNEEFKEHRFSPLPKL